MKTLVSIIIPVYNGENTIDKAICSVLNQSYDNIELIIIDDGSTDNTFDIIKSYKNNNKIKLIRQSNKGLAAARNRGLDEVKGNYILFLDSDDTLEKNTVETLVNTVNKFKKCDFVVFGFNVYLGKKLLRKPAPPSNGCFLLENDYKSFLTIQNLLPSACNKFYKSNYIRNRFNEDIVFGEDHMFNYQNLTKKTNIAYINQCFYNVQLSTENSVNKRYKKGKLRDILLSRETEENKISEVFSNDFNVEKYRKNELNALAYTICKCCTNLNKDEIYSELTNSLKNEYMQKLLSLSKYAKIHDRLILDNIKKRRINSVILISKILDLIRKIKK